MTEDDVELLGTVGVQQAFERAKLSSLSSDLRKNYRLHCGDYSKYSQYTQEMRDEGLQEGLQKGLDLGMERLLAKGMKKEARVLKKAQNKARQKK